MRTSRTDPLKNIYYQLIEELKKYVDVADHTPPELPSTQLFLRNIKGTKYLLDIVVELSNESTLDDKSLQACLCMICAT